MQKSVFRAMRKAILLQCLGTTFNKDSSNIDL